MCCQLCGRGSKDIGCIDQSSCTFSSVPLALTLSVQDLTVQWIKCDLTHNRYVCEVCVCLC